MEYNDLINRKYQDFCNDSQDDGCYGLCMEVCRRLGIDLPDYRSLAIEISNQEKIEKYKSRFQKIDLPRSGDLLLIRSMDGDKYHIAVMIDRRRFLHATREHNVFMARLNHPLYRDRIEGIYRYMKDDHIDKMFNNRFYRHANRQAMGRQWTASS